MEIRKQASLDIPASSLTEQYKELLQSLTVRNPEYARKAVFGGGYTGGTPEFLQFYILDRLNKIIRVPRNVPAHYWKGDVVDETTFGFDIGRGDTVKDFKLWDDQQEFMDEVVSSGERDVLLNAKCGTGKTIMSLYRANLLKVSTVVVVTTREIGEQFIDAVKEHFPGWSVGWAKDGNFDVTIGTYSLFSSDDYDAEYFSVFGHLILDEFHRAGAPEFGKVLMKAPCAYRTTLSATFRRKDGLEKVLIYHAGKVFSFKRETLKAKVIPVDTSLKIDRNKFRPIGKKIKEPTLTDEVSILDLKSSEELLRGIVTAVDDDTITVQAYNGETTTEFDRKKVSIRRLMTFSRTTMDSYLADNPSRVSKVFNLIRRAYAEGRTILVLSNRKSLLYGLEKLCTKFGLQNGVVSSAQDGDFVAYCKRMGRKPADQKKWCRTEARVILGIDKIAEEGLDIPRLDTIIYTYAMDDIEQSIGRILRTFAGKKEPLAYYLVDDFAGSKANFQKAKMMFVKLGHEVHGLQEWSNLWQTL